MNKKEVSEIKSLFKRDGGAIDRICGCLIDGRFIEVVPNQLQADRKTICKASWD